MEKELQGIFGERFFQFAFYVDNRRDKIIGKYWVKVETELENQDYRAWQVREKNSLEEAWTEIIEKVKKSLAA